TKGESFIDTAKNIAAMSPHVVIVRTSSAAAAELLSRTLPCSIVNAGDGAHEHPTQALLDLLTIREKKAHFDGLHVAIVGDIAHSRVARSDIHGMRKLGVTVTVAGPPTLIPPFVQELGVKVSYRLEDAIRDVDVIMLLRLQHERMTNGLIPSLREYSRYWGLTLDKLAKHARPDVLIMHPGPVNRGIELAPEVADGPYSVILDQVATGGFTAVACMANTSPVNDNRSVTDYILAKAQDEGAARVHPIGAVTRGLLGEELAELAELAEAGCVAFSDDGKCVMNAGLYRHAMEYTLPFGVPVISHAEDTTLCHGYAMNEGVVSTQLGLPGAPAAAEEVMVARDILLAELTGAHVHIAHLSTAGAVRLVRDGK